MYLPKEFEDKMKDMLKEDYEHYLSSFETGSLHHGLRVNTKKISVEDFLKISPFPLTPVSWTKNGFYYDSSLQPAKHPYYYAGLYYIQEPSAMTPASMLPIEPGDAVLDLCAAPGGKSTELAAKLNETGILISNDISNSRAKALLKNMELFGVGNMAVVSEPPNALVPYFEGFFDKILIDAPCSGEGMFRKSASMIRAWENNGVDLFVNLQRSILKEAVKMLKPGGTMLYSTCTFSPEENEQAMEYLLSLDDAMELIKVPEFPGFDFGHPEWGLTKENTLTYCKRLWPHRIEGEGHFVAMARKKQTNAPSYEKPYQVKTAKLSDAAKEFFDSVLKPIDKNRIEAVGERLYYMAEKMPDVKGLRMLRCGLFLGEMKKNRFEPSQSLAMHLKKEEFKNAVSLPAADDRVTRYLKGETIEIEGADGWCLFCVDDYPLGWGKLKNGTLKNKYLPGWRLL